VIINIGELEMIIDEEDICLIENKKVKINKDGYAYIKRKRDNKCLHRLIMNEPKNVTIDHINRNKLDNRRENLRLATISQNCANKARKLTNNPTKYKGVFVDKRKYKEKEYIYWVAKVKKNGKSYQKSFKTELEAARWYDKMAKELHGEYAYLNFP
jgi:hypothetical protein